MGKENEKEVNFYEKLEEYFKNTPREKVLKDCLVKIYINYE